VLELNKLYNIDCMDGMKLLDTKSIDLTVTSPPYDNLRTYKGFAWDFESIAKELHRVTKDGGVVVWVVSDATVNGSETGTSFKQALYFKEIGFNLHDTMIYQKSGITFPETSRYYPSFEYMFILSKGKPKTVNLISDRVNIQGNKRMSGNGREPNGSLKIKNGTKQKRLIKTIGVRYNVWLIDNGYMKTTKDKEAYKHPAMFPEQLAQDHILSWSNKGDIILDPFIGSGTTAKAAVKYQRNFIGFEISNEYFNIAQNRVDSVIAQVSMF
jgi:DNA modification methylase